ncbi:hypothetical protein JK635_14485 [Neobacillus sp. YIM B02564]|uniref:Uncharacterized protein n=1 Tax=Neobacillus paridis TaxID=2803862 RepID=A0ABS1TQ73_9BACI|nr:hypothetical protein [Neobacillus paridis]MBL4953412.1 hypothetical protein [Neobacillus paridis]
MAKSKKGKWIIGLTGTALSAFVISQVGADQMNNNNQNTTTPTAVQSMSKQEKKLAQLDWSNYTINGAAVSGGIEQSDRQTRRT